MKHTEETKKKLSEMRKGENNPFYGRHHTDEVKKHLSEITRILNSKKQYQIQPQKIRVPDKESLAYLSGFCDADGSICFVKTGNTIRPFITFYNTNRDVLDWIKETLGHGSLQYHNAGRELVQSVRLNSARDVFCLANAMLPYLIVKKNDALAVIEFLKSKYGDRLQVEE